MITTVTMNPCIDKMVTVNEFTYGGLNRITKTRVDAAGKGVTVAIAYKQLGGEAFCTGINYSEGGDLVKKRLDDSDIPHDFVDVDGQLRVNLKILDKSKGIVTEINESGSKVETIHIEDLKQKLIHYRESSDMIVFSGSVPTGVSTTIYKELIDTVGGNARVVLDTEGEFLMEGLKASPFMIKPNLYELQLALKKELNDHHEIVAGARILLEYGISIVGVSMGDKGAIIVNKHEAYYSPPLPIEVRSSVAAGDSMVAAFCLGVESNESLKDILRRGSAAAAATVSCEGTQMCTRNLFDFLLPQVNVIKIGA